MDEFIATLPVLRDDKDQVTLLRLGIGKLFLAVSIVICGTVETMATVGSSISIGDVGVNTYSSAGIWCGISLIIISSLTIKAAQKNTSRWIVACSILNITGLLMSVTLTSLSVWSITSSVEARLRCSTPSSSECKAATPIFGIDILLMLASLSQSALSIASIVLCSQARLVKSKYHHEVGSTDDFHLTYDGNSNRQKTRRLGVVEIVLASLLMVFGLAEFIGTSIVRSHYYSINGFIATGVWSGAVLVAVGAKTLAASKQDSYKMMRTGVIMNATGVLFSLLLTFLSTFSFFLTNKPCIEHEYIKSSYDTKYSNTSGYKEYLCRTRNVLTSFDMVTLVISIAYIGVAIGSLRICVKEMVMLYRLAQVEPKPAARPPPTFHELSDSEESTSAESSPETSTSSSHRHSEPSIEYKMEVTKDSLSPRNSLPSSFKCFVVNVPTTH